jgi:hypothetical protein
MKNEAVTILEAIDRAAMRHSRAREEIMEAAMLVEQRSLNINLARIADALELIVSK